MTDTESRQQLSVDAPTEVRELSSVGSPIPAAVEGRKTIPQVSGWKRVVFIGFAGSFFGLGALGAILPGIPATPFLLLASFFLVRTSPGLNQRLLRSRFFGPILVDWQVHGGIQNTVRIQAIIAVLVAVGLTIYVTGYSWWAGTGVVLLAMVGMIVILRLPTADRTRGG